MKIRFGISTKLIFMVTFIVVAAIGVTVYIATDLFKEESLTRVQETNKDVAQGLAEQVFGLLKDASEKATLMAETVAQTKDYVLTPEAQVLIQNVLRSNDELLTFGVYKPEAGSYREIYFAAKSEALKEFDVSVGEMKIKPMPPLLRDIIKRPESIAIINSSPFFKKPTLTLAFLTKENPQTKQRWLVRCDVRQDFLIELFRKKTFVTAYMVDADGNLLVHSDPSLVLKNYNMSVYPIVQKLKEGKLNNHQMEFDDGEGNSYLGAFKTLGQSFGGAGVVAQVETKRALSAVMRVEYRSLLVTAIVVGLAFLLNFVFSKSMTSPLAHLYRATEKIAEGKFDVKLEPQSHDEIGALTSAFKKMATGLQERDKLKTTFSKFHSKEVAQKILSGEIKLGGERKSATVFFSDIRDFTSISEKMGPDEVVHLLNEYMTEMVNIIYKYHGVVDKYVGDAIMALWGVPNSGPDDAINAVLASLEMRRAVFALNKKRRVKNQPEFRIGMGIHTGEVLAGNIGSEKRLEYTVIGDTVNQASRIESANKELASDILISDATHILVRSKGIVTGPPIPIRVKGKAESLVVHMVVGKTNAETGVVESDLTAQEQNAIMQGPPPMELEDNTQVYIPRASTGTQTQAQAIAPQAMRPSMSVSAPAQAQAPAVAPAPAPAPAPIYESQIMFNTASPMRATVASPVNERIHSPSSGPSGQFAQPFAGYAPSINPAPPPVVFEEPQDLKSINFGTGTIASPTAAPMASIPQQQASTSATYAARLLSPISDSAPVPMPPENTDAGPPIHNMSAETEQSVRPPIAIPKVSDEWYLVRDPLSKEHEGPFNLAQIKALAGQAGFPVDYAYVFREGDAQMIPLLQMPGLSRRVRPQGPISAPLPAEELQAEALADEWYIYGDDTKSYGPYTLEHLRQALEAGNITRTTYCWKQGMESWIHLHTIPGFSRRAPIPGAARGPIPLTNIKKPA